MLLRLGKLLIGGTFAAALYFAGGTLFERIMDPPLWNNPYAYFHETDWRLPQTTSKQIKTETVIVGALLLVSLIFLWSSQTHRSLLFLALMAIAVSLLINVLFLARTEFTLSTIELTKASESELRSIAEQWEMLDKTCWRISLIGLLLTGAVLAIPLPKKSETS
jgi:hypothetical protein